MAKSYVGDIGTAIRLDTKQDISNATVKTIKYKKPDGTLGEWTGCTVVSSTKLQHITVSSDWDLSGTWLYQAYVEKPDWKGRGESVEHVIHAHFD